MLNKSLLIENCATSATLCKLFAVKEIANDDNVWEMLLAATVPDQKCLTDSYL